LENKKHESAESGDVPMEGSATELDSIHDDSGRSF